jgi:hypothetical protein
MDRPLAPKFPDTDARLKALPAQGVAGAIFGGVASLSDLRWADGHLPPVPGSDGGVCRQRR